MHAAEKFMLGEDRVMTPMATMTETNQNPFEWA